MEEKTERWKNMEDNILEYMCLETKKLLVMKGYDTFANTICKTSTHSKRYTLMKYGLFKKSISSSITVFNYLFNKLIKEKNKKHCNKPVILFQGLKYLSIINGCKKKYDVILWDEGFHYALKNKLGFAVFPRLLNFHSALNTIDGAISEISSEEYKFLEASIKLDISNIKTVLEKLSPDIIVLRSDSFPSDRALILAARDLNIPVVQIQDGIYQSCYPLIHGRKSDYVFVWGEYFKELYISQEIKETSNVKILGYPHTFNVNTPQPSMDKKQKLTIYYFGQNMEELNNKFLDIKIKTIICLNDFFKSKGYSFIYRPHPKDDIKLLGENLPYIEFSPKSEKLEDTFIKGDLFIAFDSTALVEASLKGKYTIQLANYPYLTDNFEKLGVCNKCFYDIESIEQFFNNNFNSEMVFNPIKFNNKYIEFPAPDLENRFKELIDNVISPAFGRSL